MKHIFILFILTLFLGACSQAIQPVSIAEPNTEPTEQTVEINVATKAPEPTTETMPPTAVLTQEAELVTGDGEPGSAGLGDELFPNLGNGGYDTQHYDLQLSWDDQTGEIKGVTTINAIATQNLTGFNLDLHALVVDNVTVNGETATYSQKNGELIIELFDGVVLSEGGLFETGVTYHGVPQPVFDDSFPVGWLQYDTGVYVVSEPTGSQSWYPVNNHPSDKATYTMHITVPKPYIVAANGTGSPAVENGDQLTYTFIEDDLMASYLVTVNIAEYEVQSEAGEKSGIPITNYIEKGVPAEFFDAFENQDEILAMLIDRFGPYPYDEIGGVVPLEDIGYALETQTIPIYGQELLSYAGDFVIVHELAHQWFGNSLTPATWDQIWLNEGFATYSEVLLVEHDDDRAAAEGYVQTLYEEESAFTTPPGVIDSNDPGSLFSASVYSRGGLTLHALRLTVGDEAFFEILQTYAARFAHSNVTTEDFISVAEEISGEQLDDLFDAWLYQATLPELPDQ
ncbi:MAG: aminopeptidase N [Cellvibrionaceae bacterium]|jgi:aminopeptidase N